MVKLETFRLLTNASTWFASAWGSSPVLEVALGDGGTSTADVSPDGLAADGSSSDINVSNKPTNQTREKVDKLYSNVLMAHIHKRIIVLYYILTGIKLKQSWNIIRYLQFQGFFFQLCLEKKKKKEVPVVRLLPGIHLK